MRVAILLAVLFASTVTAGGLRPRAIAKWCVNEVVTYDQVDAIARQVEYWGCSKLTLTPIDEKNVHVYSVQVYVGE